MLVLFVLAAITVLTLVVSAIVLWAPRADTSYRPPLDCSSRGFTDTADMSLNDFVGGFVTGSALAGTSGDVAGGLLNAGQHGCPSAGLHLHQAEADQTSAFGGYEAAAQHDQSPMFDHGGFDASPSFDAGPAFDGGASFDGGAGG